MVGKSGLIILLGFAATLVWAAAFSLPDGKTHIWVLGDKSSLSLIVESPRGEWALVNPSNSSEFLSILGAKVPFYKRDLSLIVLDNSSKTSLEALQIIAHRYQVGQVWTPRNQGSFVPSNNTVQLSGLEKKLWQGIDWETWSIPGEDVVNYLEISGHRLIFANRGNDNYWASLPEQWDVDTLVGPSVGRTTWTGGPLIRLLGPGRVFVNKYVETVPNATVVGQQEIVW